MRVSSWSMFLIFCRCIVKWNLWGDEIARMIWLVANAEQ